MPVFDAIAGEGGLGTENLVLVNETGLNTERFGAGRAVVVSEAFTEEASADFTFLTEMKTQHQYSDQ